MSRNPLAVVALLASLAGPSSAGTFEDLVNAAIDRGAAALRTKQAADGSFGHYRSGGTSLAALTLIECGLPVSDPTIVKAAASVRAALPDVCDVYHLGLAILLLDKLGEPADVPLIQVLTVRLLEGQMANGAFSYLTPPVPDDEKKRLRAVIEQRVLKTAPGGATSRALDPELLRRIENIARTTAEREKQILDSARIGGLSFDNSNTQFAILGLWGGRRHGVPVDDALHRIEVYFRSTHENGTWTYSPGRNVYGKMAMTCAGLLGIAANAGAVRERQLKTDPAAKSGKAAVPREPLKDALVQTALNFVARELAQTAQEGIQDHPDTQRDYYALWSVERVGMVYSLQSLGGLPWYKLGAALLLRHQQPTGFWKARYAPEVDTCFALLYLKRADLLPDLATVLRAKPEPAANGAAKTTLHSRPDTAVSSVAVENPVAILARELQSATPEQRTAILKRLRDDKGPANTENLAAVVSRLTGEVQKAVRDALAERLARMTADTLRTKLKDANGEVRRAAAVACALKEDAGLIGDLIAALDDADVWVVRAAGVALRQLTDQDFGPKADATPDERSASVAAWKDWWRKRKAL